MKKTVKYSILYLLPIQVFNSCNNDNMNTLVFNSCNNDNMNTLDTINIGAVVDNISGTIYLNRAPDKKIKLTNNNQKMTFNQNILFVATTAVVMVMVIGYLIYRQYIR